MPRRNREQKERVIGSDDELSDSGPEVSDYSEEASELDETEVMRVQGRSDSEDDDYDYEEQDQSEQAPIVSKDAFGQKEFIGTDMTEKKRRKLKRDEKREIRRLEEEDADQRREDFNKLIGVGESESSDESDDEEPAGEGDDDIEKSDAEKLKILKRQSPELFPLLAELKTYKQEMDEVLTPLCAIFTDEDDALFVKFVKERLRVVRAYCVNIAFYLRLRAKAAVGLNDHPVMGRLAQLKTVLMKLTSEKTQDFSAAYLEIYAEQRAKVKNDQEEVEDEEEINEDDEAMADYEELTKGGARIRNAVEDETDSEEEDEDGKRKITYQIDKNKGFIPKRQKKRRNPRVKHRVAYAEAVKRRKGAVREVRKETTKYAGEASGIKVGLKKSVRTKY